MANDVAARPFTAFNFSVEISVDGDAPLCDAAFSECDGLELSQEVKTIREGGNNGAQVRCAGAATYGTLTLKRGMTDGFDLWDWFEQSIEDPAVTADAEVVLYAEDGATPRVSFVLGGCRPLKLKAPALNAKDGMVAVEELQIAYATLRLERAPGGAAGA
jgi:phage tail-like protein